MTVSEFIRQLKKQGIMLKGHGKRHDMYYNPKNGKESSIPRHQSQEIKTGTRERILKVK